MPPVTPRAIKATLLFFDLNDLTPQNFLLRDGDLLVAFFARHRAVQQLARTFPRQDDELETILFRRSLHGAPFGRDRPSSLSRLYYDVFFLRNVPMIVSAVPRMTFTRTRSARTIARIRSTAASSSSLTTTYS